MQSTQTYKLTVQALDSEEVLDLYSKSLDSLNCVCPYYAYELLLSDENEIQKLHFFSFNDEDGSLLAIMPFLVRDIIINDENTGLKDVSSPWGYNGPYFKENASSDLKTKFWQQVDEWYASENIVTEFVRFNLYGHYAEYTGETVHTLLNVRGNITDWEQFWSNLKSNTRNQFRKAEKLGLSFKLVYKDIEKEHIAAFYDLYIDTMDRRDAKDFFYHKLDYFVNLWEKNKDKCAIGLVYKDGVAISTELFLLTHDTVYSFLGGTDANYFKLRPNEYLKINAIQWAGEAGFTYYNIGGGLSNSKEDNLYLYKRKYFPLDEDVDFYTGRKILDEKAYDKLVAMNKSDADIVASKDLANGYFPKYRM